jgi:hypothetical protein
MTNHPKLPKEITALVKRMARRPKRNPKRIAGMLKVLEEVWRDEPDCRLGQIIVSAAILSGGKVVCPEIFHLEDEDMLRGIKELAKGKQNARRP